MIEKDNITILYLDDEEINLFIFEANLKNAFNIITAKTATEAFELMDKHKGELSAVISDFRMPEKDGIQFISKAREKYENMQYYLLTGFEYNEEINAALESKLIDKIFTKPFDAAEIKNEILSIVDSK